MAIAISATQEKSFALARRTFVALVAITAQMFVTVHAQPTVQWATGIGSTGYDSAGGLALASSGRIYVGGIFNPLPPVGYPDTVLCVLDQDGNLIGSQASRGEIIRTVKFDTLGNYFVAGSVWDPTPLGTGVIRDFYVAKYSADEELLWERAFGSPGPENRHFDNGFYGLAVDAAGDIYVVGRSTGASVFGNLTFPDTPGLVLCKYTGEGELLWVRRMEAKGSIGGPVVDPEGSIVVTGYLDKGMWNFGGTPVSVEKYVDKYIAKFNGSGDPEWVRLGDGVNGIAVDNQGNIYFTGNVAGEGQMQCGKLTSAGQVSWVKTMPGEPWTLYGGGVVVDSKNQPVFTGEIQQTLRWEDHLLETTGQSALSFKFDDVGKLSWAFSFGGPNASCTAGSVITDPKGRVYFAGVFTGDPTFDSFQPAAFGSQDVFVARLFDPAAIMVQLKTAKLVSGLTLSWPVEATNYVLEATTSLPAVTWDVVTNTPTVTANERSVQLSLTGNAKFFRLRKP